MRVLLSTFLFNDLYLKNQLLGGTYLAALVKTATTTNDSRETISTYMYFPNDIEFQCPWGHILGGSRKCFSSRLSLWAPVHSVHVQNKWWRTESLHNHCTTRIQFDSWGKNTSWERWKKRSISPNDINNYWGAQTLFFMFDVCWCFEIKLWYSLITFYRVFAFNYFNSLSHWFVSNIFFHFAYM